MRTTKFLTVVALSSFIASTFVTTVCLGVEKTKVASAGAFAFGIRFLDLGELNNRLSNKGFEDLEDMMPSFGGVGYGVVNDKILIGGEGGGFFQSVSSARQDATFSGGYGLLDLGFVVLKKGGLRIFPVFGFGGGSIALTIAEDYGKLTFDDVTADPKRGATLSAGFFLLNAALGADYNLALGGDDRGKGGLLVGFRVGYMYSPMKPEWKMWNTGVMRGPDIRPGGFYVHLLLGGSGESE